MKDFSRVSMLLKHIAEIGPTGCACSISINGHNDFEAFAGFCDKEKKKRIDSDTIFRIYSMTKMITCVAALTLFERGLFLLDDPLKAYLPEFTNMDVCTYDSSGTVVIKPAKNDIRIRDLFCMTSGFTYYYDQSETGKAMLAFKDKLMQKKTTLQASMADLSRIPLAFEPGTDWRYGFSHDVLGALIEVLSGKTLGNFLKDTIFEPLEMTKTFFHLPKHLEPNLAGMYTRNADGSYSDFEGRGHEHFDLDDPFESGGAGLLSTLGDYMKFARVLACGGELDGVRLLGRKTIELMATNQLKPHMMDAFYDNKTIRKGYGYGLGVRVLMDGVENGCTASIGEFGWSGFSGTQAMIDTKEKLAVVYMQQLWPNKIEYIHSRLRNVINAVL